MALALIVFVIFGLALFGNHLNLNYRSLVASTQNAKPLLDDVTLSSYSQQLIDNLKSKNADFAIISRAGQARKRLPDGVNYTHSAFWVSNEIGSYDVYNLYHGEKNKLISSLVTDAPLDFIRPTRADDVGVILPTPDFQMVMKAYIGSKFYGRTHNPSYSLISNPFDPRYQNCNEFVLNELASAIWQEPDMAKMIEKLPATFKPTEIKAGPIKRFLGPIVDERLIMKDHDQIIATTTREDLIEFLTSQNVVGETYRLDFKPMAAASP